MPLAVVVVIAIGVGAVGVGAGDRIADDRSADAADDCARGVITTSGDGAAEQGAKARADDRARDAVVLPLFAAGLGRRHGRDKRRDGKAGGEGEFTHFGRFSWET